jgi:hypothetical protein
MNKKEACEVLAEDYADKVASKGGSYDDAYEHYLSRCKKRSEADLIEQLKIAGLDKSGFIF